MLDATQLEHLVPDLLSELLDGLLAGQGHVGHDGSADVASDEGLVGRASQLIESSAGTVSYIAG